MVPRECMGQTSRGGDWSMAQRTPLRRWTLRWCGRLQPLTAATPKTALACTQTATAFATHQTTLAQLHPLGCWIEPCRHSCCLSLIRGPARAINYPPKNEKIKVRSSRRTDRAKRSAPRHKQHRSKGHDVCFSLLFGKDLWRTTLPRCE